MKYKSLPRARISKILEVGGADAYALGSPLFTSTEINTHYMPSVPLWTMEDHLLVKKGSPITNSDPTKLMGMRVAVLHGNGHGPIDKYFDSGLIKKHAVYSTPQILELVLKGRVDAGICNKVTLPKLLKNAGLSMASFTMQESPLYYYKLHLLVKRQRADFLADFNNFIEEIDLPAIEATPVDH